MLGTSDATASPVKPSSLPPRTASRPPPPQLPPKPPKPAPAPPKPILKTTAPPPPPLVAPTPEPETLPDPPPSPPPLYTGKPIGSEAPLVRSLNAAIKLLSKPPVFFAATAALAVLLAARQLGFRNTLYAAIALSWTLLALMARRRTGPAVAYFTCARESVARELVKEMLELKLIACAHILPSAASLVLVGGEVAEERESFILLNLDASRVDEVVRLIRTGYSPLVNVVAVQVDYGNQKFLNWITDTTAGSSSTWASSELNGVPGAIED